MLACWIRVCFGSYSCQLLQKLAASISKSSSAAFLFSGSGMSSAAITCSFTILNWSAICCRLICKTKFFSAIADTLVLSTGWIRCPQKRLWKKYPFFFPFEDESDGVDPGTIVMGDCGMLGNTLDCLAGFDARLPSKNFFQHLTTCFKEYALQYGKL